MSVGNQLSFLPDDYLERKAQRRTNIICAVLFVLVVAGLIGTFTMRQKQRARQEASYRKVDQEYLGEARRIEQVKEMQEKQKRMAYQAEVTASLLEKVPRSHILAEVANNLPQGVSLLDFSLESRERARAGAAEEQPMSAYERRKMAREKAASDAASDKPKETRPAPKLYDVGMKITGLAHNDLQVSQFLSKLNKSKLLKDVNLAVSEEFASGEDKLRKFQIEMLLDPAAEIAPGEKKPVLNPGGAGGNDPLTKADAKDE